MNFASIDFLKTYFSLIYVFKHPIYKFFVEYLCGKLVKNEGFYISKQRELASSLQDWHITSLSTERKIKKKKDLVILFINKNKINFRFYILFFEIIKNIFLI